VSVSGGFQPRAAPAQGGFDITFGTSALGNFLETLSFDVGSSNSSGYNQVISHVAFTIEGSVVSSGPSVPEPATLTVLSSALAMLFFVVHRRRRTR
jgi:PEP-CTERM motif-containing protein